MLTRLIGLGVVAAAIVPQSIAPPPLPAPFATPWFRKPTRVVAMPDGRQMSVPAGFTVTVFAERLSMARFMALAPNGDVFLSEPVSRTAGKIPLNQTRGYNHWTRNVIFNAAGTKLYVTVGSATNATPENQPGDVERAAIHEYNPDGSGHRLFASGLRNPVGLAWFPGSNTLWTAVNERDHLGDDLIPDFVTSVRPDGFYGWPYSYIGPHVDPTVTTPRPELVAKAVVPDVLLPSHSAALGLLFYTGTQFPAEYRNSAFIALHGSINRSKLSGYSVARVPFRNGQASGPPQNFLTGFIARDDEEAKEARGRPVGLLQLPDGSLLVSDDGGNKIWRVAYRK